MLMMEIGRLTNDGLQIKVDPRNKEYSALPCSWSRGACMDTYTRFAIDSRHDCECEILSIIAPCQLLPGTPTAVEVTTFASVNVKILSKQRKPGFLSRGI